MDYAIGDKVKVASDNDNDCYNGFRDLILVITNIATNTTQHPGYDDTMEGMPLFDFRSEGGEEIPCSLYEYEIDLI